MVYKLRATLDRGEETQEKEIIFRDIKIKSTHSLVDLHKTLKKSFGFAQEELSSFYYVDKNWKIIKEISLENMTGEEDFLTMIDITIADTFPDKNSRLLYVYDFLNFWTFHLEVLEIENKGGVFSSPLTVNVQGKMPLKAPLRKFQESEQIKSRRFNVPEDINEFLEEEMSLEEEDLKEEFEEEKENEEFEG